LKTLLGSHTIKVDLHGAHGSDPDHVENLVTINVDRLVRTIEKLTSPYIKITIEDDVEPIDYRIPL
jgi:pyoverdine/dityrosine biosynthesis protein Dit1